MLNMKWIVSHFQVGFRLAFTLFVPFRSLFTGCFPPSVFSCHFVLRFRDVENSTRCFFIVSSARLWESIWIIPQMALEGESIDSIEALFWGWCEFSSVDYWFVFCRCKNGSSHVTPDGSCVWMCMLWHHVLVTDPVTDSPLCLCVGSHTSTNTHLLVLCM